MTYEEFIKKYHLNQMSDNENIAADLMSFLLGMDFIYGNFTREGALILMGDFYDNADDIYNSLSQAVVNVAAELAQSKKNEVTEEDQESENFHKA